MAVWGYARVSTVKQASDDRTSLETQRQRITQAAISGGKPKHERRVRPNRHSTL